MSRAEQSRAEQSRRIEWIDAARGIAILLVVLGHAIGYTEDPVNRIILAFHMPLFFLLSGMCTKECQGEFKAFLTKKAKGILIPQMTLAFLEVAMNLFLTKSFSVETLFAWFLPVLFLTEAISYFLVKLKTRKMIMGVVAMMALLGFVLDYINVNTILHFEIVPMAIAFYLSGFLLRKYFEIMQVCSKYVVNTISLVILIVLAQINTPVLMKDAVYGNHIVFVITSLAGSIVVIGLGMKFQDDPYLNFIGRNSVIIYVLHFTVLKILHFVGSHLISALNGSSYGFPVYWGYWIVAVIVISAMIPFCRGRLGFFFGKTNKK